MKDRRPTNCPVVFSLDILGDKWTLVILRDILFSGKSHFREFLASKEGIASNVLSARLETLVCEGLLTKEDDPTSKKAAIYKPTKKTIDLLPTLLELMAWGIAYNPNTDISIPVIQEIIDDPQALRAKIVAHFSVEQQATAGS